MGQSSQLPEGAAVTGGGDGDTEGTCVLDSEPDTVGGGAEQAASRVTPRIVENRDFTRYLMAKSEYGG